MAYVNSAFTGSADYTANRKPVTKYPVDRFGNIRITTATPPFPQTVAQDSAVSRPAAQGTPGGGSGGIPGGGVSSAEAEALARQQRQAQIAQHQAKLGEYDVLETLLNEELGSTLRGYERERGTQTRAGEIGSERNLAELARNLGERGVSFGGLATSAGTRERDVFARYLTQLNERINQATEQSRIRAEQQRAQYTFGRQRERASIDALSRLL